MTRARRPAGARKPAASTESRQASLRGRSRPDPHIGHRPARLPRLLPALALLLCGLHLLAAAPAAAQTAPTVPQNVQATPGDGRITLTWQAPSTWGTWPANAFSIEWKRSAASRWAFVISRQPTETSFVLTGRRQQPGGLPHTIANGTAYDLRIVAISKQAGTDGTQSSHFRLSNYVTLSNLVPGGPQAISSVTVTPGAGKLDLSWTAPTSSASAITGYDVHYTSAAAGAVPDGATASGSNPAAAWVAVSRSGTAVTQTIPNLTSRPYRVRVRAVNAHGNGAWAFGTGMPQATTTGTVWSAMLTAQLVGSLHHTGCWNGRTAVAQKCSTSTTLSNDDFRVGGTEFSITQIRHSNFATGGALRLRLN